MVLLTLLNRWKKRQKGHYVSKVVKVASYATVAEGVRRRTLASSLGPPQKSHHVDDAGSSAVRAEHSQATPRQKVHIG